MGITTGSEGATTIGLVGGGASVATFGVTTISLAGTVSSVGPAFPVQAMTARIGPKRAAMVENQRGKRSWN